MGNSNSLEGQNGLIKQNWNVKIYKEEEEEEALSAEVKRPLEY